MKIFLATTFFAMILVTVSCNNSADLSRPTPIINQMPPAAKPLPPLPAEAEKLGWTLASGKRQRLADFKGQVVILDFWATNCPPCVQAIPHFVELQTKKRAEGLHIIGLHVGGVEDKKLVPDFVTKFNITYNLGIPDDELMRFYLGSDDRIPQTLVFDRAGRLVQKFVGFDSQIKADLDNAIEQALKTE